MKLDIIQNFIIKYNFDYQKRNSSRIGITLLQEFK